jgi:hypothetical protein
LRVGRPGRGTGRAGSGSGRRIVMKWTMYLAGGLVGLALLGVSRADAVAYLALPHLAAAQVVAADKDKDKEKEKQEAEAEIKANLAKLSPEDRKLAEAQKYCAVEDDNRLGEMGVPIKLTIKDQPVFLCCKGCKKDAEKDPDKTLAKVKELKAKAKAEEKK